MTNISSPWYWMSGVARNGDLGNEYVSRILNVRNLASMIQQARLKRFGQYEEINSTSCYNEHTLVARLKGEENLRRKLIRMNVKGKTKRFV